MDSGADESTGKTARASKKKARTEKKKKDLQDGIVKSIVTALKQVDAAQGVNSSDSRHTQDYMQAKTDLAKATSLQIKSATLLQFKESAFFTSDEVSPENRARVTGRLNEMLEEALL